MRWAWGARAEPQAPAAWRVRARSGVRTDVRPLRPHCGTGSIDICVSKMCFMRCCWSSPQRRALWTRAAGASRKQRPARSRTPPWDMPGYLPARRWIWCSGCASRSTSATAGSGHSVLHPPSVARLTTHGSTVIDIEMAHWRWHATRAVYIRAYSKAPR